MDGKYTIHGYEFFLLKTPTFLFRVKGCSTMAPLGGLRFASPKKMVVKQNGCKFTNRFHKKSPVHFDKVSKVAVNWNWRWIHKGRTKLVPFWYTRFRISDTIWDTNTLTTGLRQHGMYLAYMTIWISCWPSNSTTIGRGCIQGDMHLYKCVSDWCWLISICLIEHQ